MNSRGACLYQAVFPTQYSAGHWLELFGHFPAPTGERPRSSRLAARGEARGTPPRYRLMEWRRPGKRSGRQSRGYFFVAGPNFWRFHSSRIRRFGEHRRRHLQALCGAPLAVRACWRYIFHLPILQI